MTEAIVVLAHLTLIVVFVLAIGGLLAWGVGHGFAILVDVGQAWRAWRGK